MIARPSIMVPQICGRHTRTNADLKTQQSTADLLLPQQNFRQDSLRRIFTEIHRTITDTIIILWCLLHRGKGIYSATSHMLQQHFCVKSGRSAYWPQSKPARTGSDLQPNSHTTVLVCRLMVSIPITNDVGALKLCTGENGKKLL